MRKLVIVTTEGSSREDGSVYDGTYLLVSSDTLAFDELIFKDTALGPKEMLALGLIDQDAADAHDYDDARENVAECLTALGYTVETLDDEALNIIAIDTEA